MIERPRTVYVADAVRTPFGRYGGALSGVRPDDLAAGVLRALLDRSPDLEPARIDDVLLGNANGAGEENRNVARMAPARGTLRQRARPASRERSPISWPRRARGRGWRRCASGVGQALALVLER
jgi:acetyl-CoA acetyltransferase